MFWPVPDCVGTSDTSEREGSRCGATEEVMGMVRGPSEGLVMFWIVCAPYLDSTGTSQWGWGDTRTYWGQWKVGRGLALCSDHRLSV
jgi:hypothetical protein